MTHTLPELPYAYNSLEPFIDEQTMRIHHTKHHQAYVDKLNAAIEKYPKLKNKKAEEMIKNLNEIPEDIKKAVRNNGGGHINHSFFWPLLKKDVAFKGNIAETIKEKFGSFDKFRETFSSAALNVFGSGWAWLVSNKGDLEISSTSNQDSPLSEGKIPLLALDVWEHAYYLKYQNRRPEYIEAFFNVINWKQAEENFKKAIS